MSNLNGIASDAPPTNPTPGIQRLLFVADAAVADVDELPPVVRAIINAATEVHVLTPTLPGRLAWLADDVDRFRHYADERLDTVLSHMHAIGADAPPARAPAARNRRPFPRTRPPSRPPDGWGRRSSRSPTATTPPPSSLD